MVEPRGVEPLTSNVPGGARCSDHCRMVEPRGVEPLTSTLPV